MDIGKRAFSLATALVLGAAIVGLAVEPAAAEKKKQSNDPDAPCSLTGATVDPPSENDYEFYIPGEWVAVKHPSGDVKMLECQKDGTWKDVSRVAPAGAGRVPSHTFEQAP